MLRVLFLAFFVALAVSESPTGTETETETGTGTGTVTGTGTGTETGTETGTGTGTESETGTEVADELALEGNPLLDRGIRDPCIVAALGAYEGAIADVTSGIKAAETEALSANNAQKDIVIQARDEYEAAKLAYKSEIEGVPSQLEAAGVTYKAAIAACMDQEEVTPCFNQAKAAYDSSVGEAKGQREAAKATLDEAFQIKNETTTAAREAMSEIQTQFFANIRTISLDRKVAQDTYEKARIACKVDAIKEEQPVLPE